MRNQSNYVTICDYMNKKSQHNLVIHSYRRLFKESIAMKVKDKITIHSCYGCLLSKLLVDWDKQIALKAMIYFIDFLPQQIIVLITACLLR